MSRKTVAAILLSGGKGSRMNHPLPKQYHKLKQHPITSYSYRVLASLPSIIEMVIVCEPDYQSFFPSTDRLPHRYAVPGKLRQDSMFNGFKALQSHADLICIHDAARPFIDQSLVERVIAAAVECGAAAAAVPLKFTVKQVDEQQFVYQTLDRARIWEIQTPQIIRRDLLQKGMEKVQREAITVTDDVALVELLGLPVKLVQGSYANLKITTVEDLAVAESLFGYMHDQSQT